MSVIPLVADGPNPTVVRNKDAFGWEGHAACILGLDPTQLIHDGKESNVSYDLRIGNQCRSHLDNEVKQIPDGGEITLSPGSAMIIYTEESVYLPRGMYGIIAPKVTLLERGLSTTFSKIDPGYPGRLKITLFNLGQKEERLKKGERFCALTLLRVEAGAELYGKGEQQLAAPSVKQPRPTLREWIGANHTMAIMALAVVDGVLVIVGLLQLWLALRHHG